MPINIRQARVDEFPYLAEQLGPTVELVEGRVFVSELDGVLVGVLPLRLVWQAEPLILLEESKKHNKITKSRTCLMLYLACEDWIRDPLRNMVGPRWIFAVTRSRAVKEWSQRLGWFRIFKGSNFYIKHL